MVDNNTVMKFGRCIECGTRETDGFSCYELFGFPLVWEHNDPKLYELHFWLVSCYMIQHPSNYTEEGYKHLVKLFIDSHDNSWETPYYSQEESGNGKIGRENNTLYSKQGKKAGIKTLVYDN